MKIVAVIIMLLLGCLTVQLGAETRDIMRRETSVFSGALTVVIAVCCMFLVFAGIFAIGIAAGVIPEVRT